MVLDNLTIQAWDRTQTQN